MTTDPTHPAEPGRDEPRTWTPDAPASDTRVLPTSAAAAAPDVGAPVLVPLGTAGADNPVMSDRPRRRPWALVVVSAVLVLALALAGYLWTMTRAYQERAAWGENQARAIGADLATTRAELEGTTTELEGVRAQLDAAQTRITALADEKAQVGDDREAQRQLVDYQERVSEAAGTVASALERCVQGQKQLIGYLKNAAAYDPAQLAQFGTEVDGLCQSATEANQSLQDELSR